MLGRERRDVRKRERERNVKEREEKQEVREKSVCIVNMYNQNSKKCLKRLTPNVYNWLEACLKHENLFTSTSFQGEKDISKCQHTR